jgi:hypothetical protein
LFGEAEPPRAFKTHNRILKNVKTHKHIFLTSRRMVLVGYGGIWWDLVVGSFDSTRSRKLVGSVVESFDSTNFPSQIPTCGILVVEVCGISEIWLNEEMHSPAAIDGRHGLELVNKDLGRSSLCLVLILAGGLQHSTRSSIERDTNQPKESGVLAGLASSLDSLGKTLG